MARRRASARAGSAVVRVPVIPAAVAIALVLLAPRALGLFLGDLALGVLAGVVAR
jgi:hypothetical protein